MGVEIDRKELKDVIREVIREEFLSLAVSLTPYVSEPEMQGLEKSLKEEDFAEGEFVEGTKWLGR